MAARPTTMLLALLVVPAGWSVHAEQERVDGMGRTQGWVVATEAGELGFIDCQGHRSVLGSARVESATRRCPSPPTPFQMTGVIRSVDLVRRIIHAEDEAGRPLAFHVTEAVPVLEAFQPGQRIRATGPIEGQVTQIDRP
jgi:hypothetical protein